MLEFMLTLPLLLLMIYGIVEVGRIAFIFTSASNASRSAARYAAGAGENADGVIHYNDCDGIRDIVNQSAYLSKFKEIHITYDRGVNPDGTQIPIPGVDPTPGVDSCPLEDGSIRNGDRIIIEVTTEYEPIVTILPIGPLTIASSSARTFLLGIPILGSAVPTGFHAETSTPSKVATEAGNQNPTATAFSTATHLPSIEGTAHAFWTATNTRPPTLTFTPSLTPLPSNTPSATPTFISCTGSHAVTHGPLTINGNVMQMVINNYTDHILSTSEIFVEWNNETGHATDASHDLHLRQVTLANQTWAGDLFAPSVYLDPFYPYIPQYGSTIYFYFDQSYDIPNGTERIIITIGTPGCGSYPIDSSH